MRLAPANDNEPATAETPDAVSAAITLAVGAPATMTLRLDPGRHLRLRIACALRRRPAQALLTEALDAHLRTIADLDRIADAAGRGGATAASWGADL